MKSAVFLPAPVMSKGILMSVGRKKSVQSKCRTLACKKQFL